MPRASVVVVFPAIVGLVRRPSSAQRDRHLCPSLATLLRAHRRLHFTSPGGATAMNESLRAADMAEKKHTNDTRRGGRRNFSFSCDEKRAFAFSFFSLFRPRLPLLLFLSLLSLSSLSPFSSSLSLSLSQFFS